MSTFRDPPTRGRWLFYAVAFLLLITFFGYLALEYGWV